MSYLIDCLEGIVTFISPCLLPMLPVYVSYFAGGGQKRGGALLNAAGFVAGFTAVFTLLGAFAAAAGGFLQRYALSVNLFSGAVMVLLGLNFMGVLPLPFMRGARGFSGRVPTGFVSSALFGAAFSLCWTPCVGAFLGSALMLAAAGGEVGAGILMLFCYSLGLGLPFVLSAALIEQLKGAFDFVKRHYRAVNLISGGLLVAAGLAVALGLPGRLTSPLRF